MNVYLASLLGIIAVALLMAVAVKIADRYKQEAPIKGRDNRKKRRHDR